MLENKSKPWLEKRVFFYPLVKTSVVKDNLPTDISTTDLTWALKIELFISAPTTNYK